MPFPRIAFILMVCITSLGAEIDVKQGENIQAAVRRAKPGDTIRVFPGVYKETVYIDTDDIKMIGVIERGNWPILDGGGVLNDGILVAGHNSLVENFHIRHYKGNGIMHQGANNYEIRHNLIEETGIYGIFPQLAHNGLIEDNVLWGIEDAAIYVGMCEYVDVRRNEVFKNVAGIEIENSHHVLVEGNNAYDNVGGILVFVLPGLPTKSGGDVIVRNNFIYANNAENWGAPGSVVSGIPGGTGILVMAADDVTIENNLIRDNESAAIVISDLSMIPGAQDPEVDPNPDRIKILRNLYVNNGQKPQGMVKMVLAGLGLKVGGDVISTGTGTGHCIAYRETLREFGTIAYVACATGDATAAVTTKTLAEPIPTAKIPHAQRVQLVYKSVCSGCHTYNTNLIGPPVMAIQALYKDKVDELIAYIKNPVKKRDGPPMPRQDYLPEELLQDVARYMLSVKK